MVREGWEGHFEPACRLSPDTPLASSPSRRT